MEQSSATPSLHLWGLRKIVIKIIKNEVGCRDDTPCHFGILRNGNFCKIISEAHCLFHFVDLRSGMT